LVTPDRTSFSSAGLRSTRVSQDCQMTLTGVRVQSMQQLQQILPASAGLGGQANQLLPSACRHNRFSQRSPSLRAAGVGS